MSEQKFRHTFTIIDNMVDEAIEEAGEAGEQITCKKGCAHCCHLLVEVSWEEARELALWLVAQEPEKQTYFKQKVFKAAESARNVFLSDDRWKKYADGWGYDDDLAEEIYDAYFYGKQRPCPFLEDNLCAARDSRPTPCRLHLVSSDPALCSRDTKDSDDYEVPASVEELQDYSAPIMSAMTPDGRWGQMAILVERVLKEEFA